MEKLKRGPYLIESTKSVYTNPWISVREDHVIRPDGKPGIFGIVTMIPGSSVVAIDSKNNIFLVKEYKYGVGRETLELVSGGLNPDEDPLVAAKRELAEEIGIEASQWTSLGVVDPFTTVVASPNYIFLAQNIKAAEYPPEEGEFIAPVLVPFKDAIQMVLNGEITHAASCVGILRAARILGL